MELRLAWSSWFFFYLRVWGLQVCVTTFGSLKWDSWRKNILHLESAILQQKRRCGSKVTWAPGPYLEQQPKYHIRPKLVKGVHIQRHSASSLLVYSGSPYWNSWHMYVYRYFPMLRMFYLYCAQGIPIENSWSILSPIWGSKIPKSKSAPKSETFQALTRSHQWKFHTWPHVTACSGCTKILNNIIFRLYAKDDMKQTNFMFRLMSEPQDTSLWAHRYSKIPNIWNPKH